MQQSAVNGTIPREFSAEIPLQHSIRRKKTKISKNSLKPYCNSGKGMVQ